MLRTDGLEPVWQAVPTPAYVVDESLLRRNP